MAQGECSSVAEDVISSGVDLDKLQPFNIPTFLSCNNFFLPSSKIELLFSRALVLSLPDLAHYNLSSPCILPVSGRP